MRQLIVLTVTLYILSMLGFALGWHNPALVLIGAATANTAHIVLRWGVR